MEATIAGDNANAADNHPVAGLAQNPRSDPLEIQLFFLGVSVSALGS